MKKIIMVIALAVFATGAYAEEQAGVKPRGEHGGPKGGFMEQLTDEQKSCLQQQDCPRPEIKEGEKPDKETMEASRACQKKAFETCGIQMPERPEKPNGEVRFAPQK